MLLKFFGKTWEEKIVPELGPRVLLFADTCIAHMHHRGKQQLSWARRHIMRHFSISHLHRLDSVQSRVLARLEQLIPQRARRVVGPAPSGGHLLYDVIDTLFDFEADYHKRGSDGSKVSQQHQDLKSLAELLNGTLTDDNDLLLHF